MGSWWEAEQVTVRAVVAYDDEYAHCGAGKRAFQKWQLKSNPHMGMTGGDRFWKENALYCTAFVGDYIPDRGESLRRLQIGRHVFWITYTSSESWMSNSGDGACEVVGQEWDAGYHPVIRLPLWAADFVWGNRGLYAVDFNTAPGIKGTGVERLLPPDRAVATLEEALNELEPGWTPKTLLT